MDEDNNLSPEEREAKEREEYIWRFKIIKKKYKNKDIHEYNEHDDLQEMKTAYNRLTRDLELDTNVEAYKSYLIGGFMLTEWVCNEFIGIDMRGYAAQQMKIQHKYDSLLIELGEKSRTRWGMNLPVEAKLVGFILFQAGIFYLGKVIAARGGGTAYEIFKGMAGYDPMEETAPPTKKKKKMKGPSVSVDDIRKMHSE